MVTNGLDALEPGIHLDEVREMSAILDALTQKCDDLTRRSKEITSLSHTNQRRLHMLSGRLASLRVVLERRRVTATPSRIVANGHPSDAYLSDNLPPGWERSFTDDDIPYYVDNSKEVRSLKLSAVLICIQSYKTFLSKKFFFPFFSLRSSHFFID